jgi:hypothetical protein
MWVGDVVSLGTPVRTLCVVFAFLDEGFPRQAWEPEGKIFGYA